jgi:hypothetical protein
VTCDVGAVFVFTKDDDLNVFVSLDDAAKWVEAIDVDDGEYPSRWTVGSPTQEPELSQYA